MNETVRRYMVKEIVIEAERRWSQGSWIALEYALFIFVINAAVSLYTFTLPSDGWYGNMSLTCESPAFVFKQSVVVAPTPYLVRLVQETMQPESIGMWIAPLGTLEGRSVDIAKD